MHDRVFSVRDVSKTERPVVLASGNSMIGVQLLTPIFMSQGDNGRSRVDSTGGGYGRYEGLRWQNTRRSVSRCASSYCPTKC